MQRMPWLNRKFYFEIPPGWMPNVLERLHGTGLRIQQITNGISDSHATFQPNDKWSIKQHIGHLTDLETLHTGRVSDFIFREPILRPADLSNEKTNLAAHNKRSIDELVNDFLTARKNLIWHLEKLDEDTQQFASLHPRLKTQMRPVDMAYFTAEHDDHHLASMRYIRNELL